MPTKGDKPVVETPSTELAQVEPNTSMVKPDEQGFVLDEKGRRYMPIEWDAVPEGGENDTDAGVRISAMKLLSSNSPELTKRDSGVEGRVGDFYNAGTGEVFQIIEVVPLFLYQERYYSGNEKEMGNLICTSRDGKAQFGQCLDGNYELHKIPTAEVKLPESIRPVVRGVCANCPHSQRAYGEKSPCALTKHLVCVSADFIKKDRERIQAALLAGDDEAKSDLINALFTVAFKGTRLRKDCLGLITDQSARDLAYFKFPWKLEGKEVNENGYNWQTYKVVRGAKLSQEEIDWARSVYKFATSIRTTITDYEVTDVSNDPSFGPGAAPRVETEIQDDL